MAAVKRLRIKGAAAVLKTTDGGERYLYRGAVVDPSAYDKDSVKHAIAAGLVEKVDVEEQPAGTDTGSGSGSSEVEIPEGDPVEAWTVPQVDAFAKREGIDGITGSKPEKIAAITAALKEKRGQ